MKKITSLLLAALLLCALCIPALADEGVSYLNKTVANGAVQTEQKTVSAVCINATAETWGSADGGESWYVLDDNITLSCRPQILGTVNLILANGKTLTAPNGITLEGSNILNVYAQSDDASEMGEINAAGTNGNAAIGGRRGKDGGKNEHSANNGEKGYDCGTLNWHGGKLTLTNDSDVCIGGGRGGKAGLSFASEGDGPLDDFPSDAGAGGNGGIVNIYGGAADLCGSSGVGGGNGGKPGYAYQHNLKGSSGGMGGTLSVWSGTVRIQSTDGVCFGGGRGGEGSEVAMKMYGGDGGPGGNGGTLMLAGGAISFVRLNDGSSIGGGAGGLGGLGVEYRYTPGSSGREAEITITGNPVLTAGSSEQDSAPVDHYTNEAFFSAVYPNAENTASVLSEGSVGIVIAVAVVAVAGVVAVVIVKKKTSNA